MLFHFKDYKFLQLVAYIYALAMANLQNICNLIGREEYTSAVLYPQLQYCTLRQKTTTFEFRSAKNRIPLIKNKLMINDLSKITVMQIN